MANKVFDKRYILYGVVAFMLVLFSHPLYAQQSDDQQPQQSREGLTKKQKKVLDKQKDQEEQAKKAEQESIKQHYKDQTPAVRKRMKQDARKADAYNGHKKEFFLKRWFEKKKPT